jgi:hypothetical protein
LVPEGLLDRFVGRDEFAFAVGDGEVDGAEIFGPDTFVAAVVFRGDEMDPSIDESATVVVGEGGDLARSAGEGAGEEIGFNQDLKSVADADDGFAGFDETAEGVAEVVDELVGEDFAGGDVVAVAESAGEGEDFKLVEGCGFFENAIDVDGFGACAGELECVGGFAVAIGAGGTEDQGSGLHRRYFRDFGGDVTGFSIFVA